MVADRVSEYAVPAAQLVRLPPVTHAGGGATNRENVCGVTALAAFPVAVTVHRYVLGVVGVPDKSPVALPNESPGGSEPAVTA